MTFSFLPSAHSAVVTCSVFAPAPSKILAQIARAEGDNNGDSAEEAEAAADQELESKSKDGYVLVSADYDGDIKVGSCWSCNFYPRNEGPRTAKVILVLVVGAGRGAGQVCQSKS